MPDFSSRSTQSELMDDLTLANEALRQNLRELEVTNRLLGGNAVTLGGLRRLLAKNSLTGTPLQVADLGCGGGDMLRLMARWFRQRQVPAALTGIDANAFMLEYARERTRDLNEVGYQQLDVFSEEFAQRSFDIVTMTLFCHHFADTRLVELLSGLRKTTRLGLVINDLHRHPLAYYAIWAIATVLRTSHLYRHDSRLSVARAFRRQDLIEVLRRAGFERVSIRWCWAFRWQVVAYC